MERRETERSKINTEEEEEEGEEEEEEKKEEEEEEVQLAQPPPNNIQKEEGSLRGRFRKLEPTSISSPQNHSLTFMKLKKKKKNLVGAKKMRREA